MPHTRLIFAALALVAIFPGHSGAAIAPTERAALVALYNATGGTSWIDRDGWLGATGSECAWFGVTCNGAQTSVVSLILRENYLNGALPSQIGDLTDLTDLDLSGNLITGSIPTSIGDLEELERLTLSDNELTMPLPSTLFSLVSLEKLDLDGNRFSGPIPAGLGMMTGLTSLDLSLNAIRGEIPAAIANLTNLTNGQSDFRFNAIATTNSAVKTFLNSKQTGGDWEGTQTVSPTGVGYSANLGITWSPIQYTADGGTYRVTVMKGDTSLVYASPSKSSDALKLRGSDVVGSLTATIQTVTEPHGRQKNLLVSEPSGSISFSIFGFAPPFPDFVLGLAPELLVQIGGDPQNETFFTVVNAGSLGAGVVLTTEGNFFTIGATEFFLGAASTRQVTIQSTSQPPGEYSGSVLITGDGAPAEGITVPVRLLSLPSPSDADGRPQRRRVDLVTGRSTMTSSTVFRNDGADVLTGIVESDVPWIVPITETITIDPGESTAIEYMIDPAELPDRFAEDGISFSGTLRLIYPDEMIQSKGSIEPSEEPTAVSTTLATIVNTIPPPVTTGGIPAFQEGEVGYFIPGLTDDSTAFADLFTDVSIANAFGWLPVDDLAVLFTRAGETGSAQQATLANLARQASVLLAAPVNTVFDQAGETGSLQLRTGEADSILVSARLLASRSELGLLGTALPVFASNRTTGPGDAMVLTGVGVGSSRTDILVQSTSPGGARVTVELFATSGERIAVQDPVVIDSWETVVIEDAVPAGAVTAVVRNRSDSGGSVVAYALERDAESGDFWVIADWSAYWGEAHSTSVLIPVARREGRASPDPESRRRAARRPGGSEEVRTTSNVVVHNATAATAAGKLAFHGVGGDVDERIVVLAPGETRVMNDVLATLFGREGIVEGYLRFTPLRGEIAVTARQVTTGKIDGTIGSTVPIHPHGAGMRLGQRRLIASVDDSRAATVDKAIGATWRTRIALIETSGTSATVRATIRVPTGQSLAVATVSREFEVGPNEILPLGTIAQAIMGGERETSVDDLHDLQIEFYVVSGNGSVVVVTEMIENATGDSIIRFD